MLIYSIITTFWAKLCSPTNKHSKNMPFLCVKLQLDFMDK